ncbi:MAG: tetratricopeptide repeat protein [Vicinamibacterales bacterium]
MNAPADPAVGSLDIVAYGEQLASAPRFRRSKRHRRLLRHIVRHSADGNVVALREMTLALDVFDKDPAAFDPKTDAVVRVEVGRLRHKLVDYYANEGRHDPIEISLPVGSYIAVIRKRDAPALAPPPRAHAVAVLPLDDLNADAGRASFCEGFADRLTDTLSRESALDVIDPASAALAMRDAPRDPLAIGTRLGARLLLHSTFQRTLARLTIATELIDIEAGKPVWSQIFVATDEDIAGIRETIAHAILRHVARNDVVGASEGRRSSRTHQVAARDAQAEDLYERGLYLIRHGAPGHWERAIALMDQALAIDPYFAAAHAQRALARNNLLASNTLPSEAMRATIREDVERALAIDPGLALAHRIRVHLALLDHDWSSARHHAQRALAMAPGSALAHVALGHWLYSRGRMAEAERAWNRARALDPLHLSYRFNLALLLTLWRRYERAVAMLKSILDIDADHAMARIFLPGVYLLAGARRQGLAEAQETARRVPGHPAAMMLLAAARAVNGDVAAARDTFEAAQARVGGTLPAAAVTSWHVALGEHDQALDLLDQACATHASNSYQIPLEPAFEPLHRNPRWRALLARHRLPRIDTCDWRAQAIDEWRAGGGTPIVPDPPMDGMPPSR